MRKFVLVPVQKDWEPQPRSTLARAESEGKDIARCVRECIAVLGLYVDLCDKEKCSEKAVLAERLTQVIVVVTTALDFLGYDLEKRRNLMEKVNKENDDSNCW